MKLFLLINLTISLNINAVIQTRETNDGNKIIDIRKSMKTLQYADPYVTFKSDKCCDMTSINGWIFEMHGHFDTLQDSQTIFQEVKAIYEQQFQRIDPISGRIVYKRKPKGEEEFFPIVPPFGYVKWDKIFY